jgi:pimeloyl-ACP methyl ester carboxylesterase
MRAVAPRRHGARSGSPDIRPSFTPIRLHARLLVAAVAGALAASLLLAPSVASGTPAPTLRVPHPTWHPCHRDFECTRVWVPLDYGAPAGPAISIAMVKLPATQPERRIGSIFLNPGGPGGSGVDEALFGAKELFSRRMRARFDVVGFDPRGIMRSTPLRCFANLNQAFRVVAPIAFPASHAEQRIWVHADQSLAAACGQRGGPIMDHMSTADAARDLDLLRQAVGDAGLTYYGVSYGTYLGETYANLFPDNVRAVVIDGVLDPIAWATGRTRADRRLPFSTRLFSSEGAYDTLLQFFELCDRGGDDCAFSAGNPRVRFARMAHRLRVHRLALPDGEVFRYSDLVGLTLGALYDPGSWPFLAEMLQDIATAVRPGRTATDLHLLRHTLAGRSAQDYPNFVEGFPGVACADTDNPSGVDAWARAAARADRADPYFGRPWTWISSICQPWPGHSGDRYAGPFTARTSTPVLVIGNRYDPATRYQGAVIASELLPGSRLLTLDGWGHTSLFESACVDRYRDRYLLTQALPPPDTVCQPDHVPFARASSFAPAAQARARRDIVIPPFLRWMIAR